MAEELRQLAIELFNVGVFKTGKFYSTGGCVLDAWFDLLVIFAYPSLMNKICEHASKFCTEENLNCRSVCGVSYAGLPFGVLLASKLQKPLLIWSKEPSHHPADHRITGDIFKNEYCVVVEEVTCSGRSILEVIKDIEDTGMRVKDVFTLIDLEQGAVENLGKLGYKVHSMLKMSQFVEILFNEKLITLDRGNSIITGFCEKFALNGDCVSSTNLGRRMLIRYEKRVDACKSIIGQKLLKLMSEKKSNLCVEFIDGNMDAVLQVAELIGPYICILSLHWNVFENVEKFKLEKLVKISKTHNFFLMDDSKLSEDGDVLVEQCRQRFQFVDLLTIYPVSGENMLFSVKSIVNNKFPEKGVFVVAYPNIKNALVGSNHEKSSINLTINLFEEVTGFIGSKNSGIPVGYIHMMSDLKNSAADAKSSNTHFYSPEIIVGDLGADIVQLHYNSSKNIDKLVKEKQSSLWNIYLKRSASSNAG